MSLPPIISVGLGVVIGLSAGYLLSKRGIKIYESIVEKALLKNAYAVIKGDKKNEIEIDGKLMNVNRFKVRDDKDKGIIIDLMREEQASASQSKNKKGEGGKDKDGPKKKVA